MSSKGPILLALVLLTAPDTPKPALPTELDRLQGEWIMVSGRVDGVDTPDAPRNGMCCTVRGEKVCFLHDGKVVEEVTIKLDPTTMPKAIDATLATKQVAPGIYRLQEDTFTLCYTHPGSRRPTDFSARAGTGHKLSVWKRPKRAANQP
jgi:uncharacterized protein (TIGR03067 family)